MALNPHLAGDMRRDIAQLELLYQMGHLSPDSMRLLMKSLKGIANEVEQLTDELGDEPFVTVTPEGLAALAQDLFRQFSDQDPAAAQKVRVRKHLAVMDGGAREPAPDLSDRAYAQLVLMRRMGAVDKDTAVDRRVCRDGCGDLDMSAIARLSPKGLVQDRIIPANYGEPRRRLYWLTADGVKVADRVQGTVP